MTFTKQASRYLLALLLVYGLLVASHEGEFWPFSIYPMFSQAGNPWTRALVRDVSTTPDSLIWENTGIDNLAGSPVAVAEYGVDQIDFANFVSKTQRWDQQRKRALQQMFGVQNIGSSELMVMKVNGRLAGPDSVVVEVIPFLLVTADSVYNNPLLPLTSYGAD